jgi:di/tripeptidase
MTTQFCIETTHPDAHEHLTKSLELLRLESNIEMVQKIGLDTVCEFKSDNPKDFISLGSVLACC